MKRRWRPEAFSAVRTPAEQFEGAEEGGITVGEPSTREDDLNRQILDVIIAEGKVDPSRITPDATLESLEVESMDVVLILMAIEEKFGVYVPIDGQIAEAGNLNRFVEIVADHVRKAHE